MTHQEILDLFIGDSQIPSGSHDDDEQVDEDVDIEMMSACPRDSAAAATEDQGVSEVAHRHDDHEQDGEEQMLQDRETSYTAFLISHGWLPWRTIKATNSSPMRTHVTTIL